MPRWLLTIKVRQEGTDLDFMLRETSGLGGALDVERVALRADQEAIEGLLERLRAETERPRPGDVLSIVHKLGDAIADRLMPHEIVEALAAARAGQPLLTIETNEARIPWELATIGGVPLCASFACGRRMLRPVPPRPSGGPADAAPFSVLVIADPEENLPWVDGETRGIIEAVGRHPGATVRVLEKEAARAGEVIGALQQEPYAAVHFSCHASHDERDPARSRVFLHDEPVPAARLLDVRYATRPSLVFVNACESGRSRTDARGQHHGLAAAFVDLGVQAFVGPLWPVGDEASARISVLFYEALARGASVGEALREARVACAQEIPGDPLVSWASYVVYGDPGTLARRSETRCAPAGSPGMPTAPPPDPGPRPAPAGSPGIPSGPSPHAAPPRIPSGPSLHAGPPGIAPGPAALSRTEIREPAPPGPLPGAPPPQDPRGSSPFSLLSWMGWGGRSAAPPRGVQERTRIWAAHPWELEVVEGHDVGARYPLSHAVVRIGRAERGEPGGESLGITDAAVSREQAVLTWDARRETYLLEHARRATNPTLVNDAPVKRRHLLAAGDRIRMGYTVLAYVPAASREQAPPSSGAEGDATDTLMRAVPGGDPGAGGEMEPDQTDQWMLAPAYHLAIATGPEKGRTIALASSLTLEGRIVTLGGRGGRPNEITLEDPLVTPSQATLEYSGGHFWLCNDAGDGSLRVNGSVVAGRHRLAEGDAIEAGETTLHFRKGMPREARHRLEIHGGPNGGRRFPLGDEPVRIGRDPGNEVALSGRSISHLHARVIFRDGRHFLIHESRRNPTLVNGVEVARERHLDPGDEIQVSADTTLRYVDAP